MPSSYRSIKTTWVHWAALWIAATMLAAVLPASAQAPQVEPDAIEISNASPVVAIAPSAQSYVDRSRKLSFSQVQAKFRERAFEPAPYELNFGLIKDPAWIRFRIKNPSDTQVTTVLDVEYALLDQVRLFEVDGQGTMLGTRELGDVQPFHARDISVSTLAFEIDLAAHQTKTIYLRAKATGSLSVPTKAYTYRAFAEHQHYHMLILGILYGVIAGLCAYNLSLFATTKERIYFEYTAMALCTLVFSTTFDGLGYNLWPNAVAWQQISVYTIVCCIGFFANRFSRLYFQCKAHCPRFDRCLAVIQWVFFALAITMVATQSLSVSRLVIFTCVVSACVSFALSVVRLRDGYAPAKVYLLANLCYSGTIFFSVLASMQIIGPYSIAPYLQKIGTSVEMILLSFALANRLKSLKESNSRAQAQAQSALAEAASKSNFLAKMSHEIRTPMNGVLGMAELLGDSPLNPTQTSYLRTIQSSGKALLCIINDILDHSKISAGKMSIEARPFDLVQLLDELEATFDAKARSKALELTVDAPADLPLLVIGDEVRLRQVLVNLIGNALKFTSSGFVELSVSKSQASRLRFAVKDSGTGIEASAQATLFDAFSQEDDSVTRRFGGTGLGLSISYQLVSLMGGQLAVESQKGEGSTFFFDLEMPSAELLDQESQARLDTMTKIRPTQILLVAEPSKSTERIGRLLEHWCPNTKRCSGSEFLDNENGHQPTDLVLVHDSLPQAQLLACVQALQAQETSPPYRVLCHRDHVTQLNLTSEVKAKVIAQPAGRNLLLLNIDRATSTQASLTQAPKAKPAPDMNHAFGHLKVLVAEDNLVNQTVLKGMLRFYGVQATFVNNGQEAVDAFARAQEPFDLIFMDCEMPVLDGYLATKQIRNHPRDESKAVLIYALTAHALADRRAQALEAGMDEHLTKPVSKQAIKAALEQVHRQIQNRAA